MYEEEEIKLKATYKTAKAQGEESQKKYFELEITYDKNLSHFENENAKLKETIEMLKNANIKLMEEFAVNCNELQAKLNEKSEKCAAINDEFLQTQKTVEEYKEKLADLQNKFDTYKMEQKKVNEENEKQMIEAYELKISSLNDALQQKENIIICIQKEKSDMEEAKNKIIDEQSFRIKRVENAFTQPLISVASHQQNRAFSQYAEEHRSNTNSSTTTATANIVSANLITRTQSHSTADAIGISHSRRVFASSENYFSTDDESSGFSTWHPNTSSNHTTNRGFILRKRPFQRESTIPETPESDHDAQPAKRSKN